MATWLSSMSGMSHDTEAACVTHLVTCFTVCDLAGFSARVHLLFVCPAAQQHSWFKTCSAFPRPSNRRIPINRIRIAHLCLLGILARIRVPANSVRFKVHPFRVHPGPRSPMQITSVSRTGQFLRPVRLAGAGRLMRPEALSAEFMRKFSQ